MPTHAERRILPYSQEQLFALVSDVESYPQFLPWCTACRITKRVSDEEFYAELIIGYKMMRERLTSRVELKPNEAIRVDYLQGPLKYLSNQWKFIPQDGGNTMIDFYVDFEFKNPFFQKLMGVFFNELVYRMVSAFEERARTLYGKQPPA
jgi:coenzyme Q-binding protein COQ10